MASGAVFGATVVTDYVNNTSYFNDSTPLTVFNEFYRVSGPDLWITAIKYYCLAGSPMVGDPVSLLIWAPSATEANPSFAGVAVTGWAQKTDITLVAGWNTVTLTTPIKLPADSTPKHKITVAVYNAGNDYLASGFMGTSSVTVTIGSSILAYSEANSAGAALPAANGYFRYGTLATTTPSAANTFGFWGGLDLVATDVDPGGGLTTVTKTVASTWRVRAQVNKALVSTWKVRVAIAKTLASTWKVRTAVAKTVASTWKVRQAITKTVVSTWKVRVAVAKLVSSTWQVKVAVAKAVASTWAVRQQVTKTVVSTWNAAAVGALTTVTKTVDMTWKVRAQITKTQSSTWKVRQAIVKTVSSSWKVRVAIAKSVSSSWKVRAQITKLAASTWKVRRTILKLVTSTWHTGGPGSTFSFWNGTEEKNAHLSIWDGVEEKPIVKVETYEG